MYKERAMENPSPSTITPAYISRKLMKEHATASTRNAGSGGPSPRLHTIALAVYPCCPREGASPRHTGKGWAPKPPTTTHPELAFLSQQPTNEHVTASNRREGRPLRALALAGPCKMWSPKPDLSTHDTLSTELQVIPSFEPAST